MKKYTKMNKKNLGFTLIELAIALTVVALIIGGMAIPLSTRIAEQQYTDTQANIDKAVEALVGFAINNRRLPCPDVRTTGSAIDNRDGLEDALPAAGAAITGCNTGFTTAQSAAEGASWGDLPWRTLGLQPPNNEDAWNNRLRYAVFTPLVTQVAQGARCTTGTAGPAASTTIAFSNLFCQTQLPFDAASTITGITAALDIRCANITAAPGAPAPNCLPIGGAAEVRYVVAQNAVFVVYSHGANGWGSTNARDLTTTKPAAAATPNDDLENIPEAQGAGAADAVINARRRFVVRARSNNSSNAGEYDDVLTFMSANTLAAKLLNAGVWP